MKKRPLCYMCLIFLMIKSIILIMTGGQSYVKMPAASIFQNWKEEQDILIQGQVYKKSNTSKVQILYLKNNSIESQNNSFYESRILVYDETFRKIAIGETVKIKGVLTAFEAARNPGNFDRQLYYAKQNIYGSVWSEQILQVTGKENVFREKLYQIRQQWKDTIFEAIGEKNGAILSTMLLSEKEEMDAKMKELYQKNGIGHILAISGLHISFIGLGIYKLMRKAGCTYVPAGIMSTLLLTCYVLMIGFSVSVLRAYMMLLLRVGADMAGRVYDMATALALSAALTVFYQPLYLFDAGFLMSYGAILGVLLILPVVESLLPCKFKILSGFYTGIAIHLVLFPILLFFYFEFPVYSFLLNMVVIPLMSIVLGLGILGSGSILLSKSAGMWMLRGCGVLLNFFEWLGQIFNHLPGARIVFGQPDLWQLIFYYIALGGMLLYFWRFRQKKRKMKRRVQWWFCSIFVCMIFQFFIGNGQDEIAVTVLDVGQGDGIFLRGPKGGTYLIDGGSSDVTEVGKYRIEPFLKSQGVGKLDYIFLSHGDSDHYSGVEELILRKDIGVKVECLVFPVSYRDDENLCNLARTAKNNDIDIVVMKGGRQLKEDGMTITCIQPRSSDGNLEGNAGSMVLDVTFGKFDLLCTGDVEGDGEDMLVQNLQRKSYDVLKVAHHGSKNSTSEAFLECVQPKIAVISAGKKNRYGHPHQETMERLQKTGCQIYNTVQSGAVTIRSDGKTVRVNGFH